MNGKEQGTLYVQVLRDIVAQPTAPFHEERVAARVAALLCSWDVPFVVDEWGNIIAHYQRGAPCRPLALMAHMDHPACTITAMGGPGGADVTARLEGGVAAGAFERPVAVRLFPATGTARDSGLPARVTGYRRGEGPREVDLYLTLHDPDTAGQVQVGDFGVWDLPAFELRDGVIHGRALDDLAGCAAILLALQGLAREGAATNVYGIFTRAEEVGLVGAQAVLSSGVLPGESYVVSLETSKALPGALQGEGPVIRVGDRGATFSDEAELVLRAAAERLGASVGASPQPADPPSVKVQRQLMSGGRCEASAAAPCGYQATGLAFPLGNYHNVSADLTLAPETIHLADFVTGVMLLQEAGRLMPDLASIQATHAAIFHGHGREDLVARLRDTAGRIQAVGAK